MLGKDGKLFGDIGFQGKTMERIYLGDQLVFQKDLTTLMPVVLWDTVNEEMVQTQDLAGVDANRFEPVGIIVIPAEHDVYGTGECGIVALKNASLITPEDGIIEDEYISEPE